MHLQNFAVGRRLQGAFVQGVLRLILPGTFGVGIGLGAFDLQSGIDRLELPQLFLLGPDAGSGLVGQVLEGCHLPGVCIAALLFQTKVSFIGGQLPLLGRFDGSFLLSQLGLVLSRQRFGLG